MTIAETFLTLKDLCHKYCLIKGTGEIVKSKEGTFLFNRNNFGYAVAGFCDEDLLLGTIDAYEHAVEKEGYYDFIAIVSRSPAQIGNYPPPNVEVPEYMMVEMIEYYFCN
jgi:hypothetical protein